MAGYSTTPTLRRDVDGESFAYREVGDGEGPPLVLLNHLNAVIDDWDPAVVDGLAARHRVIVFDNRGVGGSTGKVPTSFDDYAKDAVAFIKSLGLTRVYLLGFSMGGFSAQLIAANHPDLVDRLIIAGSGPSGINTKGDVPTMMKRAYAWASENGKHLKHYIFFRQTPTSQSAGDEFLARLDSRDPGDRVPTITPEGTAAHFAAIADWGTREDEWVRQIFQPTFIANGDADIMVPTRFSFRLLELIPHARMSIYPDAGHAGIFQHHELFVAQALDFLSDPSASSGTKPT